MNPFNRFFLDFAFVEFHRTLKRWSYAAAYGNFNGEQIRKDFQLMLLMGDPI